MPIKFFTIIHFLFILISINSYAGLKCNELFSKDTNIFSEFGRKLSLDYENHTIVSREKILLNKLSAGEEIQIYLDIYNSNGQKVGFLVADIGREGRLNVTDAAYSVKLPPALKQKGLFRSFAKFIVDNFDVTLVQSHLAGDNSNIFLHMTRSENLSHRDAYFQTPSGKVFNSLGFKLQRMDVDLEEPGSPEILVYLKK